MTEINTQAIRDFLASFESASGHFKNSERELLLAMRDVLAVFADLSEKSESEVLGLPAHVLRGVVAILDFLVAQISETGKADEVLVAKRQAIQQLIDVLDIEAARTAKHAEAQTDLAKVEALQGLIRYLRAELAALADGSPAAKQRRQRITKIDIE